MSHSHRKESAKSISSPRALLCGIANRAASATAADAVVDAVILLAYEAVELRLTRRLRNAGLRDSLAGRRQIVPVEKVSRRRLAKFRRDVPAVVLGIGRN